MLGLGAGGCANDWVAVAERLNAGGCAAGCAAVAEGVTVPTADGVEPRESRELRELRAQRELREPFSEGRFEPAEPGLACNAASSWLNLSSTWRESALNFSSVWRQHGDNDNEHKGDGEEEQQGDEVDDNKRVE